MRTKSRCGGMRKRLKRSSAISSPSSMASPSSPNQDVRNVENNTLNETSRKEMCDVLDDIDCFRKDTCVSCDESGELLACCVSSCPVALHEYCMSCRPMFDKVGRFYCPYCSYKRGLVLVNELRRKAMGIKGALFDFIDSRVVSGDNSPMIENEAKKKAPNVSIREVDANRSNLGSNLMRNVSLRDPLVEGEQNQITKGDREKTSRGGQATVVVNGESSTPIIPPTLLFNVSNYICRHCQLREATPEVRPLENSSNDEEICEADTTRTHNCKTQDGKIVEEENLRSMDPIRDEGIVGDQGQPQTSSACHAEEETDVDDIDHSSGEQENIIFSKETPDKSGGGERIQLDEEGMQGSKNVRSGSKDLGNEASVKKRRVKSRAGRRLNLENIVSPRKSPRPRILNPEPGKNHVIQTEEVSASKNLKRQKESPKQIENLKILKGRRKKLHWSTEEVEMLREGVHKFSTTANINLPWRKILEFGHHIFDKTRTPVDLKDKWRNVVARF